MVNTRNVEIYGTRRGEEIYTRAMATPHLAVSQDVANVVFYLGSDQSRMITGHVLPVDGGLRASQAINADYRDWFAVLGGRDPGRDQRGPDVGLLARRADRRRQVGSRQEGEPAIAT